MLIASQHFAHDHLVHVGWSAALNAFDFHAEHGEHVHELFRRGIHLDVILEPFYADFHCLLELRKEPKVVLVEVANVVYAV